MSDFIGTVIFSFIMGFSIYLSMPILLRKKTNPKTLLLLNAIAIGILIFLISDIFSDVAPSLYNTGSLYGYGANISLSVIFAVALTIGFFMLYFFEKSRIGGITPTKLSLMIAIGIGLQNLTEGLVFGSLSINIGLFSGAALVVLIGFILQNITEGFPIAAPLLKQEDKKPWKIFILLLVGGLPTVIGGIFGYYFSSITFNIFFDGLAIGAILYVILPMIRHQFKDVDHIKQRMVYVGIFLGFLIGFLVNLI